MHKPSTLYLLLYFDIIQTLNQLLRRRKYLCQQQTRYYIYQLALGLLQIHNNHIIHRDIKLCNLFINQRMKLKIGDFGLANQILNHQRRYTICGTANYMAPEIIDSTNINKNIKKNKYQQINKYGHGYEVDVWSLGVVCYSIFYGVYPFQHQEEHIIYQKIINCQYQFPSHPNGEVSKQFKSFIKQIFQVDYNKRITLQRILEHQFLNKTQIPKQLPVSLLKYTIRKEILQELFKKKQRNVIIKKQEIKQSYLQLQNIQTNKWQEIKNIQIIDKENQLKQNLLIDKKLTFQTQKQQLPQIYQYKIDTNYIQNQNNIKQIETQNIQQQQLNQIMIQNNQICNKQNNMINIRYFKYKQKYILSIQKKKSAQKQGIVIKIYKYENQQHENIQQNIKFNIKNLSNQLYSLIIHPKLKFISKVNKIRRQFQQVKENIYQNKIKKQKFQIVKIPLTNKNKVHCKEQEYHEELKLSRLIYKQIFCH